MNEVEDTASVSHVDRLQILLNSLISLAGTYDFFKYLVHRVQCRMKLWVVLKNKTQVGIVQWQSACLESKGTGFATWH